MATIKARIPVVLKQGQELAGPYHTQDKMGIRGRGEVTHNMEMETSNETATTTL
jgi:hypothetical protein